MNDAVLQSGPSVLADGDEAERERLASLAGTDLLDSPAEEGFDRITRLAQSLFGLSTVTMALVAQDRQYLKSVVGTLAQNTARAESFCTHTIRTPDTLVVEDARNDERFRDNPWVLGQPNIRFYAGHPLQGPGGWNIGTLCLIDQRPRTFDVAQQQVLQDLSAVVQREINVRTDLRNGARIQQAHLPVGSPAIPGYEVRAATRPAGDLSGDFYDWQADGDVLRFTVADVMGKGTGPAILGATVRAGLRAAAVLAPGEALAVVSDELMSSLASTETFVTAFHAELHPATGTLRYSDAGHGLAHHVSADGQIRRLPTSGPPLAVTARFVWETRSLTLAPGEALVVPTDGLLELLGDDLDLLAPQLQALAVSRDLPASVEELLAERNAHGDDLSLLVIRREGGEQ